jgi:hypothetical protein
MNPNVSEQQPKSEGKVNFKCSDVGPKNCDWQVSGNSEGGSGRHPPFRRPGRPASYPILKSILEHQSSRVNFLGRGSI